MDYKKYLDMATENKIAVIILLIVLPPVGIFLLWRGGHFAKNIRWAISAAAAVWTLMMFSGSDPATYSDPYASSGCTEVYESGGCTYYRDSDCVVIAQSCS